MTDARTIELLLKFRKFLDDAEQADIECLLSDLLTAETNRRRGGVATIRRVRAEFDEMFSDYKLTDKTIFNEVEK